MTTTPHDTTSVALPLAGASVLLAGAGGGIGNALADELHRRGAVLTLVGRRREPLDRLSVPGKRLSLDLRSVDACEMAIDEATRHGGQLDVVINAVGVVAFGTVDELSIDAMEELFLTNTFIPIMLARAALPRLTAGGAIVNFSGVIAEQNLPGLAAYGASKAAVKAFDEAMAREARRRKVRVIDARPPHPETGLADRPIEGRAPKMPTGLAASAVAMTVCDALEDGTSDLPSDRFHS